MQQTIGMHPDLNTASSSNETPLQASPTQASSVVFGGFGPAAESCPTKAIYLVRPSTKQAKPKSKKTHYETLVHPHQHACSTASVNVSRENKKEFQFPSDLQPWVHTPIPYHAPCVLRDPYSTNLTETRDGIWVWARRSSNASLISRLV